MNSCATTSHVCALNIQGKLPCLLFPIFYKGENTVEAFSVKYSMGNHANYEMYLLDPYIPKTCIFCQVLFYCLSTYN